MQPLSPTLRSSVRVERQNGVFVDRSHAREEITAQDVRTYDERSGTFELRRALELRRPGFTDPLRALGKDAQLLELAAGRAAHSLKLLSDGYRVIISDVSPKSVEWAQRAAQQLRIADRGMFMVLDATRLPFADASIDGIFMTASLHHFPRPSQALAECRRVLKPGGVLLVGYEPSKWSYLIFSPAWRILKFLLRRGGNREVSAADDQTGGFTMGELRFLAIEAGFDDAKVFAVDFLEKIYEHAVVLTLKAFGKGKTEYRPQCPPLRAIDSLLARIPLLKRMSWNYDLLAHVHPFSRARR